jgi:hypothetical protein
LSRAAGVAGACGAYGARYRKNGTPRVAASAMKATAFAASTSVR